MYSVDQYLSVFDNSYKVSYQYSGVLKHDKITTILKELKDQIAANYVLLKKIYAISNELLENALYHASKEKSDVDFLLVESSKRFRVIIFNYSTPSQFEEFAQKIEEVNNNNLTEVKTSYQNQLLKGQINEKGTIGVGLELVRLKSKNKILLSVQEIQVDLLLIIDVGIDKE